MKLSKLALLSVAFLLPSCAVVNQDQIGVKRTFGKLDKKVQTPGVVFVNP